ncbi:MAG: hypothetical protein D6723_19980 [Acidobacteria bacterium]|nr:MAG: hypothetical protein D6723_19980 [Acidobacteriota bacterium]
MNFFYFDASAIVKRYSSAEHGADLVNDLWMSLPADTLSRGCLEIGIGEVVSALVRQRNDGRLTNELFKQALALFRQEIIDERTFLKVPIHSEHIQKSLILIVQHNLNATDALILQSALELLRLFEGGDIRLVLVTADERLARAATAHELVVFNPEVNTRSDLNALLSASTG